MEHVCGGTHVYCPMGSAFPVLASPGFYTYNSTISVKVTNVTLHDATMSWRKICEMGYYCKDGVKYECPGGTFGYGTGFSSEEQCLSCRRGYYCPSARGKPSTNAKQLPCGSVDKFCPDRSALPQSVSVGYYTKGGEGFGNDAIFHRTHQEICPKGSFCLGGVRYLCPKGTYGEKVGLSSSFCDGFCPEGFFCEEGTILPLECPENYYSERGWSLCISCNTEIPDGQKRCKNDRKCCRHRL